MIDLRGSPQRSIGSSGCPARACTRSRGIARLLRCSWEAVDAIVSRVVVDHVDDSRLDNLYRIGVDEISYKRGRKFPTIVADHDTGNVIWIGKLRSKTAFEEFFAALGPERAAKIEAISLDGSVYLPVTREQIPQARICLDPFHVIKWTNEVVESGSFNAAATATEPRRPQRRHPPLPRRNHPKTYLTERRIVARMF